MSTTRARAAKIAWSLAIVLASASAGILVDWQAPGIGRYTRDWLMRARGPLPVPDDIAIVAIDETSMVRFGRFPWSRQVIARTIDTLAAAHPKVIALDVLFTDPTTQEDDDNLARSIGRAGNVVVAAQLTDSPVHGGPSRWLQPLPAIERAAASVGHVNAQTELDGIVRQVAVRLADDNGRSYRLHAGGGRAHCRRHARGRRHRCAGRAAAGRAHHPAGHAAARRRDRPLRIHAGLARRPHDHRLHRPRRLLRPGYLQPLRCARRARAGRKIPRQVRADRRHRRLAGRPRRLAVRALHGCARRSTRRADAGRGSAGQCHPRHSELALLHGAFRHRRPFSGAPRSRC